MRAAQLKVLSLLPSAPPAQVCVVKTFSPVQAGSCAAGDLEVVCRERRCVTAPGAVRSRYMK
jgi:hypothetical protein